MNALSKNFVDLFEFPLPVLSTSLNKIDIVLSQNYNGFFSIENAGGGMLAGDIYCSSKRISFSVLHFESNFITVDYSVNVKNLDVHSFIDAFIIIKSNGGEKNIPVTIKIVSDIYVFDNGIEIESMDDFCELAYQNPLAACEIFVSVKFENWIKQNFSNYFNVYTQLLVIEDKERALDNFLRIVFDKPAVDIEIDNDNIEYYIKYVQKDIISGQIKIKKTDYGFVFCQIFFSNECQWLSLSAQHILNSDFDQYGEYVLNYDINKHKIVGDRASVELIFKTDISVYNVSVSITLQPVLNIWLSKESFFNNDIGEVLIENNSGKMAEIAILSKDSFIKFEAKKYYIDSFSKIPFQIKLSMGALSLFTSYKNKTTQFSEITVKTTIDKRIIRKKLKVIVVNG